VQLKCILRPKRAHLVGQLSRARSTGATGAPLGCYLGAPHTVERERDCVQSGLAGGRWRFELADDFPASLTLISTHIFTHSLTHSVTLSLTNTPHSPLAFALPLSLDKWPAAPAADRWRRKRANKLGHRASGELASSITHLAGKSSGKFECCPPLAHTIGPRA